MNVNWFLISVLSGCLHSGAALTVDNVAFGVLTCSQYLQTRLRAQRETWLRHVRHVVAFTEESVHADVGVDLVLDRTEPQPEEELNNTGAWRALAMVESLYALYPDAQWYVFVDDDTYVYVSNLVNDVLAPRDPMGFHYVGWTYRVGPGLEGLFPGEALPVVNIGGAGFAISSALMARLAPRIPACRRMYSRNWQGDVRIAKCIDDLGYEAEDDGHLHADNVDWSLRYGHGSLKVMPPASFHHVTEKEIRRLYAAQMVYSIDGTWQVDFARFALREITHHEVSINRTFRMRFGMEVNVTEGQGQTELQSTGRANELVSFSTSDNFNAFEQKYRGDVCSSSASNQTLAVTIQIVCGGCKRNAAAKNSEMVGNGGGSNEERFLSSVSLHDRSRARARHADLEVCHVAMLDECVYSLLISLHCPSKQPSLPEPLNIGTSALLSAGVAASAWRRLGAVGHDVSLRPTALHALRGAGRLRHS